MLSIAPFLLAAAAAYPPPPPPDPRFDALLVPIFVQTPVAGGFGTLWTQELVAYNGSGVPLEFPYFPCSGCNNSNAPSIAAGSTAPVPTNRAGSSANPSAVIFVNHDAATDAHFRLRVFDLTRPEATEVEIPLVVDSDYRSGKIELLDVPGGPDSRLMLRVYAPDLRGFYGYCQSAVLTIRAFRTGSTTDARIGERLMLIQECNDHDGYGVTYAQTSDIPGRELLHASDRIRIEIAPQTPLRYWVFVTSTDNATQHITVHLPAR